MVPKEMEFLPESHVERRKDLLPARTYLLEDSHNSDNLSDCCSEETRAQTMVMGGPLSD